jgi:hypothetical protein
MVGSSIRAVIVGLSPIETHKANTALATVVFLQSILSKNLLSFTFKLFFFLTLTEKVMVQYRKKVQKNKKRALLCHYMNIYGTFFLNPRYTLGFWVLRIIEDRNFSIRKNKNITHMCTLTFCLPEGTITRVISYK